MDDLPAIEEFRESAIGYWSCVGSGDPRRATAETEALDVVVESWRAAGVDGDRLMDLLRDPSCEVRYAAATYLGPGVANAVEELRRLTDDPTGLVAPTAKLLLMMWRE